jgi:hypothetical protein
LIGIGPKAKMVGCPPTAIITVVGLFDWIGRARGRPADGADSNVAWHVYTEAGELVADNGRGGRYRANLSGARSVRVVPLTAGDHHAQSGPGWQVALALADGDALVGKPSRDWQSARELARLVCEATHLPLDEMTEKLFSRVGNYTRPPKT